MNNKTSYMKLLPWLMLASTITFFFYSVLLQVSSGVIATQLKHAFNIDNAALGLLTSMYFYSYAPAQIPLGTALDAFGARRLLIVTVSCCAVGTFLFASSHIFALAVLGRLLMGLGSAAAYVGCAYIAANWISTKHFSLLNGTIVSLGMLGAVVGQAPLALVVAKLGWQMTLVLLGFFGLFIAMLFWVFLRPPQTTKVHFQDKPSKTVFVDNLKHIIKHKQTWLCAIYTSLMYTPVLTLGSLWGVPFLTTKYQLPVPTAASLISTIFIGFAIGAPILGWLSDHFCRRNIFIVLSSLSSLLVLSLVIYTPHLSSLTIAMLLFIFGITSSGFIVAFSVVREINPSNMVGTAMGFLNCVNMLGCIIFLPAIGLILDWFNSNKLQPHTTAHYEAALATLPLVLIIACILTLWIKETYGKPASDYEKTIY